MIREPRSAFVGRHRELATLESLLDASSLVTLTGVGGTGKTRLAMRAANSYAELEGIDCWFVPLESVEDPLRSGQVPGNTAIIDPPECTRACVARTLES